MPRRVRTGAWARVCRLLRWCAWAVLVLVLVTVGGLLYLQRVGLPDFFKGRLVGELRERGVELEYGRMYLDWDRGVVAERVRLVGIRQSGDPTASFSEVVIRLDGGALRRLRVQVRGLELLGGELIMPAWEDEAAGEDFGIESISAELRFLSGDRLELRRFSARCLGTQVRVSGVFTNLSALRKPRESTQPGVDFVEAWRRQVEHAVRVRDEMRFGQEPELELEMSGDLAAPAAVTVRMGFEALDVDTPWGAVERLEIRGELNGETGTNGVRSSRIVVEVRGVRTRWSGVEQGGLEVTWKQSAGEGLPLQVDWNLELAGIQSPWGESPGLRLEIHARPDEGTPERLVGDLVLSSESLLGLFARAETNRLTAKVTLDEKTFLPTGGEWTMHAEQVVFQDGSARQMHLDGQFNRLVGRELEATSEWAWWAWFEPVWANWRGQVDELRIKDIVADRVQLEGQWRAPRFQLTQVRAELSGRDIELAGAVEVDTRRVTVATRFDVDVHELESLLTVKTDRWLDQFSWDEPPRVQAKLDVIWPEWSGRRPDWRVEVLPTLVVDGYFESGRSAFRGVTAETVQGHFTLSNGVWHLPDLVARRPEGVLELSYTEDTGTRDYRFGVRSGIGPGALEPLLGAKEDRALELMEFAATPLVEGEVWGRWRDRGRLGFRGRVEATGFKFRGEPVDELTAGVSFTNGFVSVSDVQLRTGDRWVTAVGVGYDVAGHWLYLTNATAFIEPERVTRAIGPRTEQNLAAYQFLEAPRARVEGSVNVKDTQQVDMQFEIAGGPFRYWRFEVPEVEGTVRWVNGAIAVSNLQASFYGGTLDAEIHAEIPRGGGGRLRFQTMVNRASLNALMEDLFMPTNRLEGTLNVNLNITEAHPKDPLSWQGFGRADLRDGFLWGIPLFGLLSPVLDTVVPGLGRSRIGGATATFKVTNSVVHTEDMELRAPLFRLGYRGAVDMEGRVEARVEARLFRDAWVIGPLVSLVFSPLTKLFEYHVTGTLARPELELLYIPKPLQMPFSPFRTLREMFEEENGR
jgi:hypothetical protein